MQDESRGGNVVLNGRDGSYALLEVIGRGAYGTVYKGIWREVGRHVAIKRVSRSRLSADEEKALQTEVRLFKNLKYTHIVNYIEAVDNPESDYLDIVMEYVEGGSLHGIVQSIRKSKPKGARVFEEGVVADHIRQVALGLRYLHRQGVVHRDIKGANILVTKESHVKLTDFGVSSTKPQGDLSNTSNPMDIAGSPYWMAPEIISLTGSSTASDIWSLGCTVIELLTGFPPYHELSDVTALFRIVSDDCPPLPTNLSADCEDFLRKCFNKDMHTRATTDQLLDHRWLKGREEFKKPVQQIEIRASKDNIGGGKSNASLWSARTDASVNTQTSLGMYEEEGEEDFDDMFGEDDDNGFISDGKDMGHFDQDVNAFDAFLEAETQGNQVVTFSSMDEDGEEVSKRDASREDPFKYVMDDPVAEREREKLRRQKEQWSLVKAQATSLGQSEDVHIAACNALVEMFHNNPELKYYLIYDPGLLPIIEVLESGGSGNERVVEAMLKVTLTLLDDADSTEALANESLNEAAEVSSAAIASFGFPRVSNIREDLCLAGFLPVVMKYCRRSEPFQTRLLSAKFLEKMLEWERALHIFVACRGFSVFVDMLEPDITSAGELTRIALVGIEKMLLMENQRHKRDFCRRFAWGGLLDRIVEGFIFNMEYLKDKHLSAKGNQEKKMRIELHLSKLAHLLQTFAARADPTVKAKMIKQPVLYPIVEQIANRSAPDAAVLSILCSVRDLSRDPQTHEELQAARAIETLVQYLSVSGDRIEGTKARHFIISSLHNLCIVSPGRQELAVKAGLVPHLQRYIRSQDYNLGSLCIDMYSGLACAGPQTRVELSKHSGVDFYVELLIMLSVPGTVRKWQARVLQSISEWLEDPTQHKIVENDLITEKNRKQIIQALAKTRFLDVEGVLEAYLRIITVSQKVNKAFGTNQELILIMVRWLEKMYSGEGGAARGRLLLLRTLLAHATVWKQDSGVVGLIRALRCLLTDVVLETDEAIIVREQATLLLGAIDRSGIEVGLAT